MLLASLLTALAGNVYINSVRVEPSDLAGLELKSVNVRTDVDGNVWIDAPGYTVRPVLPEGSTVPGPAPTAPVPGPAPTTTAPMPGPTTGLTPATAGTVPPGRFWLYVEDDNSSGHVVDVSVNGVLVTTVRSGTPDPIILDVGKWLRPGENQIVCRAVSTEPAGGPLYVYLGRGQDNNGTVEMGSPDVQFGVGRSRSGETRRTYTFEVN
ncbi:MAG: hypothetical protein H6737_16875 [Alphaproteobacteria bacterium]|nr:hypothetical protein [Alphaproteobacteria bacterium]